MLSVHHNKNKSRIPMPITSQQRRNNKEMNKAVVTPAKSDQKKNNNKSSLFSTTCSRMAQETRNHNKPYIKSEHSHKKPPPPLSSFTTRNSNNNKMNKTMRKSPITQLKEDLETWRQKKLDDELLVQKQSNAISKLKKQLALQAEIQQERQRKTMLQSKLKAITAEIESLSIDVVDSLDVKNTLDQHALSYTDTIKELQSQLKSREDDFKRKLGQYQRELQHKEQCIQQQQTTRTQLQRGHAHHIAQLNTVHMDHVQTLQAQYQKEASAIRASSKPCIPSIDISSAIEQALNEFEQEQHNHAPSLPSTTTCTPLAYHPVALTTSAKTNQQWYSKRYMPIDAMSWPAPQAAPNLKRQIRI